MITKSGITYDLTSGANVAMPVTVGVGYRRLLTVGIYSSNGYPDSVTFNGVAMTLQGTSGYNVPWRGVSYWSLANPPVGTYNVEFVGAAQVYYRFANVWYGVDETTPVNTTFGELDNGTSLDANFTTTVNDCYASLVAFNIDWAAFTDGTYLNFTGLSTGQSTQVDYAVSDIPIGVAGVKALSFAGDNDSNWFAGIAIAPAVAIPILTTEAATNIGLRSAALNGNVEYDAEATISERGFVISTNANPTISDTKFVVGGTLGDMTTTANDLEVNTLYHVRAFATNANGTAYGEDVTFTTSNITATDLIKDIGAIDGETWAIRIAVTGTTGSVTVMLGTTGDTDVFEATGGTQEMQGTYEGTDGLILRMSADFNGTIDNVQWVRVAGVGTIDWDQDIYTTVFPISSEVFFKRIEDDVFNSFRLYRYLDLLFKDLDGFVTVTVKSEANDAVTSKTSTFTVGNTSNPASPFSKRRISFLCKDQAIIIGLSNASLNETFAIAKFILSGHKRPRKMFGADTIISVGND